MGRLNVVHLVVGSFIHSLIHLGNTHLLINVSGTVPVGKDTKMGLGSSLPLCVLLTQYLLSCVGLP